MVEIVNWCYTNVPGEASLLTWDTIVFHTERARTLFMLRWS